MDTIKKIWVGMLTVLGLIIAAFFYERAKRKDVEAKLENSEYDTSVKITETKIAALETEKNKAEEEAKKEKQVTNQELLSDLKKL